ncbi:unnamed protein product [Brassica oleracea var. botrytis]
MRGWDHTTLITWSVSSLLSSHSKAHSKAGTSDQDQLQVWAQQAQLAPSPCPSWQTQVHPFDPRHLSKAYHR